MNKISKFLADNDNMLMLWIALGLFVAIKIGMGEGLLVIILGLLFKINKEQK